MVILVCRRTKIEITKTVLLVLLQRNFFYIFLQQVNAEKEKEKEMDCDYDIEFSTRVHQFLNEIRRGNINREKKKNYIF